MKLRFHGIIREPLPTRLPLYLSGGTRPVAFVLKGAGEGSRGGHVIGHTRSGKAVYHPLAHTDDGSGGPGANLIMRPHDASLVAHHGTFGAEDHEDAAKLHREHAASSPGMRTRMDYEARARWHDKEGGKAKLDAMPHPGKLAEDHGRYFEHPPGTTHIPLDRLHPMKSEHTDNSASTQRAEKAMHEAYHGRGGKRAPLTVHARGDGHYDVADGNATFAAARKHGWSSLPALVHERGAGSGRAGAHGSQLGMGSVLQRPDGSRSTRPRYQPPAPLSKPLPGQAGMFGKAHVVGPGCACDQCYAAASA